MSILLCREGIILQHVTPEKNEDIKEIFVNFLHQNIKERSRILISSSSNVYIPALIQSLKICGHCFIPVNSHSDVDKLSLEAKIHYIISLNNIEPFNNAEKIGTITLSENELILWKYTLKTFPKLQKPIMCIIPSSGTTGERKLISIEFYCIEKNVDSLRKIFGINEKDVIYFGSPITFDPSLVELLLAIQAKASLLMVPENVKLNPQQLFNTLFSKFSKYPKVTFLQIVPSLLKRWSENQVQYILNESDLRILALGGEPFPFEIIKFERSPNLKLYNLYGITELSCWATVFEIKKNYENEVYLGDCLEDTKIKVCDNDGREIDEGIGEIFIGSDTRHCYLNDESKASEWSPTGDLVHKSTEGIRFKGRKNNCFKRFGHRITLEFIDEKIFRVLNLSSKSVWCEKSSKLLLFILIPSIYRQNKLKILDKLKVKLLHSLSNVEFPDFIDILSIFPITSNGKIDKKSLIQIYEQMDIDFGAQTPVDIFLTLILKYLGQNVKNYERFKEYSFFELGGNSILFTLLTNDLRDNLISELPSEFGSLLLEEKIGNCVDFLKDSNLLIKNIKRKENSENLHSSKRSRTVKNMGIVWKYNLRGCVDASPLVFQRNGNTFVAVGSFSNFFVIIDAISGKVEFEKLYEDSIGSRAALSSCSNFLYFGCFNGKLYCINLETYETEWIYRAEGSIKCTPVRCLNDEAIVFGSYDKFLHCVNSKNGKIMWKTEIMESVTSTPVIHESSKEVVVTTISGSCIALSEITGKIIWRLKFDYPIFSSPFAKDNKIFFGDVRKHFHCINIENGEKLFSKKIDGGVYSSAISIRNYLILTCHKGFLYKFKTKNSQDCEIEKKLYFEESITTTACILEYSDNMYIIVVTVNGNLHVIDFEKMVVVFTGNFPNEIYSSPVIFNNQFLYVGCRDDNLYCLNVKHFF